MGGGVRGKGAGGREEREGGGERRGKGREGEERRGEERRGKTDSWDGVGSRRLRWGWAFSFFWGVRRCEWERVDGAVGKVGGRDGGWVGGG